MPFEQLLATRWVAGDDSGNLQTASVSIGANTIFSAYETTQAPLTNGRQRGYRYREEQNLLGKALSIRSEAHIEVTRAADETVRDAKVLRNVRWLSLFGLPIAPLGQHFGRATIDYLTK